MKRRRNLSLVMLLVIGLVCQRVVADGPPPTPEPPAGITSVGTIASATEPGEKLRISGQVYAPDGMTPAVSVIVYAYQTDGTGHYQNDPTTHIARLHGWARTDGRGQFEFATIRPAPYPSRHVPAHVHFHVWGSGYPLQWTKDLFFADDSLLQRQTIEEARREGRFSNVCDVSRNPAGTQVCHITFRLSKETNYPAAYRDDPRTH